VVIFRADNWQTFSLMMLLMEVLYLCKQVNDGIHIWKRLNVLIESVASPIYSVAWRTTPLQDSRSSNDWSKTEVLLQTADTILLRGHSQSISCLENSQ
jgi:hypothetical protein